MGKQDSTFAQRFGRKRLKKLSRDVANRLRYGSKAPLVDELFYIDPLQISLHYDGRSPGAIRLRKQHSGQVMSGDWDLRRRDLYINPKYQAVEDHFQKGVSWEDTGIIDFMMRRMREKGGRYDGCMTREDALWRYERLDKVHDLVKQEGRLRTRAELPIYRHREQGGILVHVTRDGVLLKGSGGAHRLAIARVIPLPYVPIQIGAVHPEAVKSGVIERMRVASAAIAAMDVKGGPADQLDLLNAKPYDRPAVA